MNNFQDMSFINGAKRNRWKILNLSEVINDESRKVVKIPKREYLENGHYPIIDQGKSFIGGYTDLENGIYNEVPFLVFGDHTRVVKYVENPSFIGADGVKVLKNKLGEEELNTRYLYYFLNNVKLPNTGYNRHFKFLKQVVIPIPPIETQKKIVDVLDKAQEIINKRKQQITALSTLTQSVFVNMFIENDIGNGKVPLKELCEFNPKKSELKEEDPNLGVSFIPMESVSENGDMELNEIRTLEEVYKKYTYFREGDVLFAKITPCMENGKGAIATDLVNHIGFGSTEFHVLRPSEKINKEWLYYLTKTKTFRKQAEENMTGSAGQKRVPKKILENYQVNVPDSDSLEQFSKIIGEVQSIKKVFIKSLNELETLYQSLTQKAFKGELFSDEEEHMPEPIREV